MTGNKEQLPRTLGELKKSGWRSRSVKEELKENLVKKIKREETLFPGIIGYQASVEKGIINAILAHHNFIFLGLRGQGKTKIIRSLTNLLDEKSPIIKGSPLNEDPFSPISPLCREMIRKKGDSTPIEWIAREKRFNEKLATPDVSMSDLIGDIDPIKAAREKLDISNEEVIHWGIIPRSNRGIFAINELPDLQARIQVGLFNILEENDVQVRGFPLRLPLDILLVFSANPEDYTNRGRIITPLKDRISSEIITHYPNDIKTSKEITKSEAMMNEEVEVSDLIFNLVEEITFNCRKNEHVDKMSGVSQRLSISILELAIANAKRRKTFLGTEKKEPCRILDLYAGINAITGKIELLEETAPEELKKLAAHIINLSITKIFDQKFPPITKEQHLTDDLEEESLKGSQSEYEIILDYFKRGNEINLTDDLATKEYYKRLEKIPDLKKIVTRSIESKKEHNHYLEIALEGLYGHQVINRKMLQGGVKFFDVYSSMFKIT